MRRTCALFSILGVLGCACGGDGTVDIGIPDGAVDANDGAVDATEDATDATVDAVPDGTVDATVDSGEDARDGADASEDAGSGCRSNEACEAPLVCSLFIPEYPCGGAPPPRECDPSAKGIGSCPDGQACFPSCGGTFCVPDCVHDPSVCDDDQVCGAERYCRPPDCRLDEPVECPPQFECAPRGEAGDANGCRRIRCTSDAQCGGGICAEGSCFSGEGTCARDPGPPP